MVGRVEEGGEEGKRTDRGDERNTVNTFITQRNQSWS